MKLLSKQFSILVSLFLLVCEINAQNYEPAIAVPVSGISIDGNLTDWPKGLKSYEIGNLGFGELEDDKDCEATFMVAYNSAEKSIYLGVEVIDSKIVSSNSDNNIDLLDYMLLYLDPIHNPNGGSSLLFQAGGNLKEKFPAKPKSWNPYSPELTWEDVKVQTGQQNGKLIYEWKINLGNFFSIDSSYGLDFVISDIDEIEDGEIWKIWKNGMAKSAGAHRIGDLILAKDANSIGKIKGKVNIKDEKIKGVNEIRLQSIDLHNIWCRTIVDSLGNFSCELPEGAYEVLPWSNFTSHINSADFNQHSRKIINQERCVTKIKANSETLASNLNLICEPHPLGLFEEKGLLISSTFNDYKIDNFIKTYQAYFDIPGVSLALIKEGEIVYDKTFGTANSLTNEPLTKEHLFEGASTTKSVFALMVLKMAEEGKIDLDKPLYQYLSFPNIEHDERYKLITARHVLNHQTGLDNWPIGSYTGFISDDKADLGFDPGSNFKYSGEAMNYLGRVVEKIKGKKLSQIFEEEIAPAFGMQNSHFSYSDKLEEKISLGHYHKHPRYKDKHTDVDSPASSLMTNASDFIYFAKGLLNGEYISPESYQLIQNIYQEVPKDDRLYSPEWRTGIAYGFFVVDTPDGKLFGHGGNNLDFDCKFGIMPKQKVAYAVFTNSNLGDEFIRLLELYLFHGKQPFDQEFQK